jgi:hypothetical protein
MQVECLEESLRRDIDHRRFIPYIQLHEFEALLFADPRKFRDAYPGALGAVEQLARVREEFPTPEHIDNRPESAPSKRILNVIPDYRKSVAGPLIAARIGLRMLCQECPHFSRWIGRIKEVASQT